MEHLHSGVQKNAFDKSQMRYLLKIYFKFTQLQSAVIINKHQKVPQERR